MAPTVYLRNLKTGVSYINNYGVTKHEYALRKESLSLNSVSSINLRNVSNKKKYNTKVTIRDQSVAPDWLVF